jgi:osmoprotectant transport system substrate-binding protein
VTSRTRRRSRSVCVTVVVAVASAAALGACGGDDDPPDFAGVDITVGSRDFTEQLVLSSILIQALDEFGANVVDSTDTGDIATTRAALESGDIDAYWEYNSAALVEVFGRPPEPGADGADLTDEAADIDASNSIAWVGRGTFNNTYGFALSHPLAEEHQTTRYSVDAFDLDDLAELLDDDADLVVCVEDAFVERADGLVLFEDETGFTIPDDQLLVVGSTDEIYPLLDSGDCDVGEVFTTDGQIAAFDLDVVEDPGVFLVYNVSLTIRDEVYDQAPDEFDDLVDDILGALSQSRMTELNAQVASGAPVDSVADDFVDEFIID